ncbi:MAG: hypothetical protein OER56_02910 [Hyphomicrobiales bacterium]|nr:hypothetical protein [Hyphomicrobiales bacterium]
MTCSTGLSKKFADEVVSRMKKLTAKYGLEDVVVERDHDPVVIAARGCLKDADGKDSKERIEILVQLSADLAQADKASLVAAEVTMDAAPEVYRAYDLSDVVAEETVARASEPVDKPC